MAYNVIFDYDALQKDLGILPADLPQHLSGLLGEKITKAGVYAWFARERMTVERLVQLLAVVRMETDRKLNIWKYIRVVRAPGRRAA